MVNFLAEFKQLHFLAHFRNYLVAASLLCLAGTSATAFPGGSNRLTYPQFHDAEIQVVNAVRTRIGSSSPIDQVVRELSIEAMMQLKLKLKLNVQEGMEAAVIHGLETRVMNRFSNPGSKYDKDKCNLARELQRELQDHWLEECARSDNIPGTLPNVEDYMDDWGRLLEIEYQLHLLLESILQGNASEVREIMKTNPDLRHEFFAYFPSHEKKNYPEYLPVFGYVSSSIGLHGLHDKKVMGAYEAFVAEGGMLYFSLNDNTELIQKLQKPLSALARFVEQRTSFNNLFELIIDWNACHLLTLKGTRGVDFVSMVDELSLKMLPAQHNDNTGFIDFYHQRREKLFDNLLEEAIRSSEKKECYLHVALAMQQRAPSRLIDILKSWIKYQPKLTDWKEFDLSALYNVEHIDNSLMYDAAEKNNLELFKIAMMCNTTSDAKCHEINRFRLNVVNSLGETPVFHALKKGSTEVAMHMLNNGADFDPAAVNLDGSNFLSAHLKSGGRDEEKLVNWLVDYYQKQWINDKQETLLHLAVQSNNHLLARRAMELRIPLLAVNTENESLIDIATREGSSSMLSYLLDFVPSSQLVQLDNETFLAALTQAARDIDLAVRLRLAFSRYANDSAKERLTYLAQNLIANHQQEPARMLMAGTPCPLYEQRGSTSELMHKVCMENSSVEDIKSELDQNSLAEFTAPVLFGMTPLHVSAMLSHSPEKASQFRAILDSLVSLSWEGLSIPDHNGKTIGHYLIENNQPELLFRWLLHTHNADWPNTGGLYSGLIRHALERNSLETVSVLQMFWIPVYDFWPWRSRHRATIYNFSGIEESCSSGTSALQYAGQKGMLDWVRQYYPSEQSPLDQFFSSSLCDGYQEKSYQIGSEILALVNKSRVLTLNKPVGFNQLADLLIQGANPNEAYPSSGNQLFETIFEIINNNFQSRHMVQNFALAIIFGADIKEQYNIDSSEYGMFSRKPGKILQAYREALINPSKDRFSETANRFIHAASEVKQQLGLTGRMSHIHPACTCLTLERQGDEAFKPWCQVKADMPGAAFSEQLREICEEYGYADF